MSDSAMILHDGNGSALSAYQDRDDVRELGDRLMAMHPAAGEVGPAAMRAAAQLALMLGANPLPGVNEMHIWKDEKGRNCMSLGINYWRRKGNEWGGYLYQVQPRPMKPAEMAEYGIANGTAAAICKGVRAADMIQYRQMGFTTNEVWDMCGRTGVGTQGPNEYSKKGRPSIWTSLKRAETDMLRQLFPAEFARIDQQTMTEAAPLVTIEAIEPGVIDGDAPGGDEDEVEEGRYTLEDANADLGLGQPPAAVMPAAQPVTNDDGPLPDDEQAIYETPAGDFLRVTASFLDTDFDELKAHLKALGYSGVPGVPEKRLAAYRALKAAQFVVNPDDHDARADAAHDEPLVPLPAVDPA